MITDEARKELERSVLKTLWYFDALGMTLTAWEVWRMCLKGEQGEGESSVMPGMVIYRDVLRALEALERKKKVEYCEGRYRPLFGKTSWTLPKKTLKISEQKLRSMKRWVRLFQFVPFVRAVIVTGGLSSKTSDRSSDWDVLIVVSSGHIWTARVATTVIMRLFDKWRRDGKECDRFCLNHFIADTHLNMRMRDLYSAKEYALAFPLLGEGVFQEFLRSNTWMRSHLPLWNAPSTQHLLTSISMEQPTKTQIWMENLLAGVWLESRMRRWQKQKIDNNPKTRLPGSYIVVDDDALIFLPNWTPLIYFNSISKKIKSYLFLFNKFLYKFSAV